MSIEDLYDAYVASAGVSTDTRSISENEIFFALTGDNFDGNSFAEAALDAGASLVVVSRDMGLGDEQLVVDDTLKCLQELALHHRERFHQPVLGITGSNGKTTTKELTRDAVSARFKVQATKGNLNNHIGVPLSVLDLKEDCDFAIIEMGANHQREIAALCEIARPTHGLITNVGFAHLEGFGGFDGVKKGKSELYDFLSENNGTAFVNVDEEHLSDLSAHVGNRVFYGSSASGKTDISFKLNRVHPNIAVEYTGDDTTAEFTSDLYGEYNARNVMTAIAVALHFDVPVRGIREKVAEYRSGNNRSQVTQLGDMTIVLDAYNANPSSMQRSVDAFAKREGKRVLILGGMNELGDRSKEEHAKLIEQIKAGEWSQVLLVGEHFEGIPIEDERFSLFEDTASLELFLKENALKADAVLLKGSRSNRLESVVGSIH